ncbi:MAG: hypothetical protein KIS96_03660 [Bauldia sp.]|nr:hypothetical protein [Bauldia sp.]
MNDWPFAGLERGSYGAIVADPPWSFRAWTSLDKANFPQRRDPEKHYPIMGLDGIKALPVRDLAAPDCHLFLWVTGPMLPRAVEVIEAWGFRYSGVAFTWIKLRRSYDARQLRVTPTLESDLHVGLGLTTRKNAEFCLLARRGNCKRASKAVREVILAPVRQHSRKPEEFRRRVEQYVGPDVRIAELFARESRPGWATWGLESAKFDAAAA